MVEAGCNFPNKHRAAQLPDFLALPNPLRQRKTVTRREFSCFGFEFFDAYAGKYLSMLQLAKGKVLSAAFREVFLLSFFAGDGFFDFLFGDGFAEGEADGGLGEI